MHKFYEHSMQQAHFSDGQHNWPRAAQINRSKPDEITQSQPRMSLQTHDGNSDHVSQCSKMKAKSIDGDCVTMWEAVL